MEGDVDCSRIIEGWFDSETCLVTKDNAGFCLRRCLSTSSVTINFR